MKQAFVQELFAYENGALVWKPRPQSAFRSYAAFCMWNKRYANRVAGSRNPRGYIKIAINKRHNFAHRLIWLYHYGYMPETVDHINNNPSDNRLENLRAATITENRWNSRRIKDTTTNVKGVYKRSDKSYEAHICTNYKRVYLGRFVCKRDAIAAVTAARKALHKEFARDS
jgi:hypothetical protein